MNVTQDPTPEYSGNLDSQLVEVTAQIQSFLSLANQSIIDFPSRDSLERRLDDLRRESDEIDSIGANLRVVTDVQTIATLKAELIQRLSNLNDYTYGPIAKLIEFYNITLDNPVSSQLVVMLEGIQREIQGFLDRM